MTYNLTIDQRRKYYAAEKERKGDEQLRKEAIVRRANRLGRITVAAAEKYSITCKECGWLANAGTESFYGKPNYYAA